MRLHRQGRVFTRSLVFLLAEVTAKPVEVPPLSHPPIRGFSSPPPYFFPSLCCIIPPLINVTALLILSGLPVWKFTRVAIQVEQPPGSPGPGRSL